MKIGLFFCFFNKNKKKNTVMFQALYWALEYADQEEGFPPSWELTSWDRNQIINSWYG